MYSLDEVSKAIAALDDYVLIQRWNDGQFSDEARPVAASELQKRGIDLQDPVARPSIYDVQASPQTFTPRLLPALFAAFSAATFGRELGAAIWGYIGAGIASALMALLGWYVGGFVARFAHKRKHFAVRFTICAVALLAWLFLCGFGIIFVRLASGAPLR